ncbi:hypothetical protein KY362_06365 [Candidatus Woesearchaeota archaeon]|nr:hypothetical protein [Candidatus Woesearchaeota archaeon]
MAKKKSKKKEDDFDDDFDDYFDDYDDDFDESKPKKKTKGRKKKGSKVWVWILAFIVVLAILLFIRFKYATPEDTVLEDVADEEPPVEFQEKYVPEPEGKESFREAGVYEEPRDVAGPDVVEKEELPKVQEVIDTTIEPELFSNVQCNFDYDAELLYISLRIYNNLEEEIKISPRGVQKGYNTYFLIRGVVDTDPGCGTELLHAGEWTECERIGFDNARYGNVEGINRISVQVPGKTEALLVECPEKPDMGAEEE